MSDPHPATSRDIARAVMREAAIQAWGEPDHGGQKILDYYADTVVDALAAAGRLTPDGISLLTITGNQRKMSSLLVELADVVTRTAELLDPAAPDEAQP